MGFAPPPSPELQPFSTQGPAYTDPLQTLAQMQEMRTRGLQQQSAGMTLQQQQLKMNSQQAMLKAFQSGGGDPEKTYKDAVSNGVLPEDLIAFREHQTKLEADLAGLEEKKRTMLGQDIGTYTDLLAGVKDQPGLDAANAEAQKRNAFQSGRFTPLTVYPGDPDHVTAYSNSLLGVKELLGRKKKQTGIAKTEAETEEAKAKAGEATAATALTGLKTTAATKAQAVSDIRAAELDPQTGTPTPAAWQAIRANPAYAGLNLPPQPTKDYINKLAESTVPQEKMPEYNINKMKADLGLMGNTEFDQFMLKHAQSLNTTPLKLTPAQFEQGMQKYREYNADPTLRDIVIGQKGLQEQMTRAQLASMPTPEGIDLFAKMAINHEMSPDQFNELRSGRTSVAPQIIMRAKQIDPNFNMARLEAEYKAMTKAEADFGTGPKGDLMRANNNTIEHMGQLDMARQALGSNNIPLMRSIAQQFGVQFGADAPTTYDLIAKKVGDEFTKSFIPGAGGEKERIEAAGDFRRQLGDTQIGSNIKAAIHAMDVQQQNLLSQYKRSTYGKGQQGSALITPEAKAVRDRLLGTAPAATAAPPGMVPLKVNHQGKISTVFLTPTEAARFTKDHPDIVVK